MEQDTGRAFGSWGSDKQSLNISLHLGGSLNVGPFLCTLHTKPKVIIGIPTYQP